MTGAELKTILTGLGLPPTWFADYTGTTMRTVVRWFDEEAPIRPRVAEAAEGLMTAANEAVADMCAEVLTGVTGRAALVVKTYRTDEDFPDLLPASWHRMVVFRVSERLGGIGDSGIHVEYV
jgi:hypothetical protein